MLRWAVEYDAVEIIKMLLDAKANVHAAKFTGKRLPLAATCARVVSFLQMLLSLQNAPITSRVSFSSWHRHHRTHARERLRPE